MVGKGILKVGDTIKLSCGHFAKVKEIEAREECVPFIIIYLKINSHTLDSQDIETLNSRIKGIRGWFYRSVTRELKLYVTRKKSKALT